MRNISIVLIALSLLFVVKVFNSSSQAIAQDSPPAAIEVQGSRFCGNIGGAPAVAVVGFEQLREYAVMSGQIQSGQFVYTFKADIVGNSGFGDMVSHAENTRFWIKIDVAGNGFALTSNPLRDPTTYFFRRC